MYKLVTIFKQFKAIVKRETSKQVKFYRANNSKGEFRPRLQEELKILGI